ncbi:MAG: DUF2066 domain-containing protein [Pseudomonadota bacterium]|nr:DUF2066 domain-containing protein [Pseudomonadota bacterium]
MPARLNTSIRQTVALGRVALVPLLFALSVAAGPAPAASPDSLFTVARLDADVTAADAVTAKKEALEQAHQTALRTVMKRLVPLEAYSRLPRVRNNIIESMLEGLSVRSEQNSRIRYIARLDFEFQPQAVRDLLSSHGIPISEHQAEPITVLPVYIAGGKIDSTGRDPWRKAWLSLDLDHAVTPVKLARVTPSHTLEQIQAALGGDLNTFAQLRDKAQAQLLVLAVAEPEQNGARLSVRLFGADRAGSLTLARSDKVFAAGVEEASARSAAISLGILEGRWKVTSTSAAPGVSGGPSSVRLVVEFASLKQWQDIRRRLSRVPGVQSLEVISLSARVAEVAFNYTGTSDQLGQTVTGQNLSLENQGGTLVLKSY